MGDPAGIGPEIILKVLRAPALKSALKDAEVVVTGTVSCFEDAASRLGMDMTIARARADGPWPLASSVAVLEASPARTAIRPGELSPEAGRLAYYAIESAVQLALQGKVDALVTAPINKEALHLAGYGYPGHTEILAELTGSPDSCMLLVHDRLRVAHVSTHTALAKVPSKVTPQRLRRVITLTGSAMLELGIAQPRLAVAALNPHAGEEGAFGEEDRDIVRPVVEEMRAEGVKVEGPVPGDTVFVKACAGQFDAVIAMYHDQGHIPIKLLGFSIDPDSGRWTAVSGVNVTLGLPIIRTSVDHGTAFDIAGKGIANEQSLHEAINLAVRLSQSKNSHVSKGRIKEDE
jgi:4-hydroxythreonine-4-phosphate dehydrogenase